MRITTVCALFVLLVGCGGAGTERPDSAGPGGQGTGGTGGGGGRPGGNDGSVGPGTGGGSGGGGSAGAIGSGGSGGKGGTGGAAGTTGSGGAAGTGGAGGAGTGCGDKCKLILPNGLLYLTYTCCNNTCVDMINDHFNCGACGNRCPADKPLCHNSACTTPTCNAICAAGTTCCGGECCAGNDICCEDLEPIPRIGCFKPTATSPSCHKRVGAMSDRNIKRAVTPVDPQQVLTKVSQLPISTWQYKSDPDSVRHMGPMAQDFKQAFGLGDSDRWYHTVDGHGVALASIQALARLAAEQREQLEALQRQNAALERRLRALERR